jgi:putative membrane protein
VDAVLLDASLAYFHHLGIGLLIVCLGMETALIRMPLTALIITRLARIDAGTGLGAAIILVAGVGRVMYGLKGGEFYIANHIFWAKMTLFALVAGASIPVTLQFLKWRRAIATDAAFLPDARKIRLVWRHLAMEWVLLLLIPLAAVLMARGFGMR